MQAPSDTRAMVRMPAGRSEYLHPTHPDTRDPSLTSAAVASLPYPPTPTHCRRVPAMPGMAGSPYITLAPSPRPFLWLVVSSLLPVCPPSLEPDARPGQGGREQPRNHLLLGDDSQWCDRSTLETRHGPSIC